MPEGTIGRWMFDVRRSAFDVRRFVKPVRPFPEDTLRSPDTVSAVAPAPAAAHAPPTPAASHGRWCPSGTNPPPPRPALSLAHRRRLHPKRKHPPQRIRIAPQRGLHER